MRANLGQIALVGLLSISFCGCKSTSNMFAWGKKKPTTDAPAFNASVASTTPSAASPTLPSAGQTPGNIQNNVPGTGSSALVGAPANATPSLSASYATTPAAYQQTAYPTTPYSPVKLASSSAAAGTMAGSSGTSAYAASPTTTQSTSGYTVTTGTLAPPMGYSAGASVANSTQPQSGFYNPGYEGAGATPAAASNPAYNASMPNATASAVPEYRTADVRGATQSPTAATTAAASMSSPTASGPAASATQSYGSSQSNLVGDRYASPQTSAAMPAVTSQPASGYPSATSMPSAAPTGTITPAAAPSDVGDRYSQPASDYRPGATNYQPGATNYQPGATNYQPGNTGFNPPNAFAPTTSSTTNSQASDSTLHKDSGYRPGGTSDYAPGGNMLRPSAEGSSTAPPSETASKPAGVVPASYEAPAASTVTNTSVKSSSAALATTSPSAAPSPTAPAAKPTSTLPAEEQYGSYQGSVSTSEPAYGAASPTSAQTGAYQHTW